MQPREKIKDGKENKVFEEWTLRGKKIDENKNIGG